MKRHTTTLVMVAAMILGGCERVKICHSKPLTVLGNEQSSGTVPQQRRETALPDLGKFTSDLRNFFTVFASRNVDAKDYYVSTSGDDLNPGTTPDAPLRSLERVSALSLRPGDRVLFRGNETFLGNLKLMVPGGGSLSQPIEIASYGSGRPIIRSQNGDGISAPNVSGLIIRNLTVAGTDDVEQGGRDAWALGNGIRITSTDSNHSPSGILISDVEVYGFRTDIKGGCPSRAGNGILIDTQGEGRGVQNVIVARVNVHHQDYAGINSISASGKRHENILILSSEVDQNFGIRGSKDHTGNGIVLSSVNGALIEGNKVHDNGKNNEAVGGPVGIWAWEAKGVVIRRNMAYRNRTSSSTDGGGFDFDGGVTDSIMEDNISFENAGAGYLLSTYPNSDPVENVIIRNNMSLNDGRKNSYGALHVFGDVRDSVFEGNDVHVGSSDVGQPWGVKVDCWTGNNIQFRNNHFSLGPKTGLFSLSVAQGLRSAHGLRFVGNSLGTCGSEESPFQAPDQGFDPPYQRIEFWREGVKPEHPFTIRPIVAGGIKKSDDATPCPPHSEKAFINLVDAISVCTPS